MEAITDNRIIKDDNQIKATIINLVNSGAVTVEQQLIRTDIGTPQGGVISPLLANIIVPRCQGGTEQDS
jgi:retron-type reverse transcriptase